MLAIEIEFTAGKYHATPWDSHVNEGAVEWPPSPWRLCRALLAAWHRGGRVQPEEDVLALMASLAQQPPSYVLPKSTIAHSRHYMPIGLDKKKWVDQTTKVFDTFIAFADDRSVVMAWPQLELDEHMKALLEELLDSLSYFGRAESWAELRVLSEKAAEFAFNVVPTDAESQSGELIRVLAPVPLDAFSIWRDSNETRALAQTLAADVKKAEEEGKKAPTKLTKAKADRATRHLPKNFMEALEVETAQMRRDGWSQAPGSRWVAYSRPDDIFAAGSRARRWVAPNQQDPNVLRFLIASTVQPGIDDALSVCERVRQTLIKYSDGASIFSGHDRDGAPLEGHQHAYVWAEANPKTGKISHISLYAKQGFHAEAREAATKMRKVWGREGFDIALVLASTSSPEEIGGFNIGAGQSELFAESSVWESATPFVPVRHAKTTRAGAAKLDETGLQIGSPEHDLIRLAKLAGLPNVRAVERISGLSFDARSVSWLDFGLKSRSGGTRASRRGYGFRLHFEEPVRGPIALGYGAHRGLGLFRAAP